jgi:NADPH2:quinone reductase
MPRAVQITAFGGPEQLQIVDLPVGEPGPGRSASATTPAA